MSWSFTIAAAKLTNFKRKRVPKTSGTPVDIRETNQFNNGNIEVMVSDESRHSAESISVDEVLINGRKYRVPERIIILDFWNKLRRGETSDSRFVYHQLVWKYLLSDFQRRDQYDIISAHIPDIVRRSERLQL